MLRIAVIAAVIFSLLLYLLYIESVKSKCPYGVRLDDHDDVSKELAKVPDDRLAPGSQQLIPQIIIQTNRSRQVPKGMADTMHANLDLNPDYGFIYYEDHQQLPFIRSHFPLAVAEAYEALIPGAYKADLFRYCVLYIRGGVYIDSAMKLELPFSEVLRNNDTFVSPLDRSPDQSSSIFNAFMATVPRHPIVARAIDISVYNIKNRLYTHNPLGITGPLALGKAFEEYMGEKAMKDKDYGNGVRIVFHKVDDKCRSGEILDGDKLVLFTRYLTYLSTDRKWYYPRPHYSQLWDERKVYVN